RRGLGRVLLLLPGSRAPMAVGPSRFDEPTGAGLLAYASVRVEGAVGAAVGTERGRGLRATERPRVRGPFERSGVRRSALPIRGVGTVVGPGCRVEEAASGAFRARCLLFDIIGVDARCVLAGIDRVGGSAASGGLPHESG